MGIHLMPPLFKMVIEAEQTVPTYISLDGWVARILATHAGEAFTTLRNGAGTDHGSPITDSLFCVIKADQDANQWLQIRRAIFLFDTSGVPASAQVLYAELQLFISSVVDTLNCNPEWAVYASNPASDIAIVNADYGALGTTILSNAKGEGDISVGSYNSWVLNTAGLAAVTPGGLTKLGLREVLYDVADTSPTWVNDKTASIGGKGTGTPADNPVLSIKYRV